MAKARSPGRGKKKGSAFERAICKTLSKWWTDGQRTDVFWRTQSSGGRATIRSRQGLSTHGQFGDVQASDPIGDPLIRVFMFELKHGYSKTPFFNYSKCELSPFVLNWIEKAELQLKDPHCGSLSWALIYKMDNMGELLFIPVHFFRKFARNLWTLLIAENYFMVEAGTAGRVLVIPFRLFLETVSKQIFCESTKSV